MRLFKRTVHDMTFDDFMTAEEAMHGLGFSVSAYPPDYGLATCLNCRARISISVPESWWKNAVKHRTVCGSVNLSKTSQEQLSERMLIPFEVKVSR